VCVRTVQNAVAEAVRQGHICREERERKGRKNLTNILRIVSREWLAWIDDGTWFSQVDFDRFWTDDDAFDEPVDRLAPIGDVAVTFGRRIFP